MIFLPFLLLSRCIAALPSTPSETSPIPTINFISYDSRSYDVACIRGNVDIEIITTDEKAGDFELEYTLKNFSPWMDHEASVLRKYCKLNFTIDIPAGWRAEIDRDGGDVDGYVSLPDNGTATFAANYIFASTNTYVGGAVQSL